MACPDWKAAFFSPTWGTFVSDKLNFNFTQQVDLGRTSLPTLPKPMYLDEKSSKMYTKIYMTSL